MDGARSGYQNGPVSPALRDVLDLTQRYKRTSRTPGKSKGDKLREERVEELKKQLDLSKKNVVRHLIKTRQLEQTIQQQEVIDDALKQHLMTLPFHQTSRRNVNFRWLDHMTLQHIDMLCHFPENTAFHLQHGLNSYSDTKLLQELDSFPLSQLHTLNKELYVTIVWVASGKRISYHEASLQYDTSIRYLEHQNYTKEVQWIVLKRILCTALRLRHLSLYLCQHRADLQLQQAAHRPFQTTSISATTTMKPLKKSRTMNSPTKDQFGKSAHQLSQQLQQSQRRQQDLSQLLQSSLSLVSKTLPITAHKSAAEYARKRSIEKFHSILSNKLYKYYAISFVHWQNCVKVDKAEVQAKQFLRLVCSIRLFKILSVALIEKQCRYMQHWRSTVEYMNEIEELSAIVQIQRMWRGALDRIYVKNIHRIRGAMLIQRVARGYNGRKRVRDIRHHNLCVYSVSVIEKAWQRTKWIRTLNLLRILHRRMRAASRIQRVYRGHRGRKRYHRIRMQYLRKRGATKMQSIWRRYRATLRVCNLRTERQRQRSAIKIQCLARKRTAYKRVNHKRRHYNAVCTIQRGFRCHIAYKEMRRRLRIVKVGVIQRSYRGYAVRKTVYHMRRERMKLRNRQAAALAVISPIVLGYNTRRKWKPRIAAYKGRRRDSAVTIQRRFGAVKIGRSVRAEMKQLKLGLLIVQKICRVFLARKIARKLRDEKMNKAATVIQTRARGMIVRCRPLPLMPPHMVQLPLERNSVPVYFRLKHMYYRDLEAFHHQDVLRIQRFYRCSKAKYITKMKRQNKAARVIQRTCQMHIARKLAKAVIEARKRDITLRNRMALRIQKVFRGHLGRKEARKHYHVDLIKKFIRDVRSQSIVKNAFLSFRIRKMNLERAQRAAVKIQALGRGYNGRKKVRRMHKRLVQARDKRIRIKRNNAAVKIQGMARIRKAKNMARAKRIEYMEREKKRKQLEELEGKLETIHSQHMDDLLAIRVQKGARQKLAKTTARNRAYEKLQEDKAKFEALQQKSATKIQALARGVRGRRIFSERLPDLKKAQMALKFCVECEVTVATRKCRQCRDRYCDDCYTSFHRKGHRREHDYELLKVAKVATPAPAATRRSTTGRGTTRGRRNSASILAEAVKNPNLWEECWDDSAQAKYWYHTMTGEATWICPF